MYRYMLPLFHGQFGSEEDVALIGIHLDGKFYELDPSKGEVSWDIAPWGSWRIKAETESYVAIIQAECKQDMGTVLRAPTEQGSKELFDINRKEKESRKEALLFLVCMCWAGLKPFCRDTFDAECTLSLWRIGQGKQLVPIIEDATSKVAAAEVGGEEWWDVWSQTCRQMNEPYRSLVGLPIDLDTVLESGLEPLRPPGL